MAFGERKSGVKWFTYNLLGKQSHSMLWMSAITNDEIIIIVLFHVQYYNNNWYPVIWGVLLISCVIAMCSYIIMNK